MKSVDINDDCSYAVSGLVKSPIAGGYFVKTKNTIVSVMSMIAAKAE